jgi:hypothetical protein
MVAAMLALPAPPPVARAIAHGETQGTLRAAAQQPGALGIPIEGCQLSTGGAAALVIQYRPRTLRIDGQARRAERITTAIRFGTGESHALKARLQFSLHAGGRGYRWTSSAGRLTWADGLRAGSFRATLTPGGGAAHHTMRLHGSWRRCFTSPTP